MTLEADGDSLYKTPTSINDTDSPYVTQGEDTILVDTSNGAVTVRLASGDTDDGRTIEIVDAGGNASSNAITVDTEGSETIEPGGASSKTIQVDDARMTVQWDESQSKWISDRQWDLETLSADGVLNSDIGDGVDYANPFWLTRSDAYMYNITNFASTDNYTTITTNGSISTSSGGDTLTADSTATDDSDAAVRIGIQENQGLLDWDRAPWEFRFGITVLDNLIEAQYITRGRIAEGSETNAHVGVGIDANGDFVGTVADGSNRSTTTLDDTPSAGDSHDVRVLYNTTDSQVEFYIDGNMRGSSPDGTISTNLPTGGTGAHFELQLAVWNADSGGSRGRVRTGRMTFVQNSA